MNYLSTLVIVLSLLSLPVVTKAYLKTYYTIGNHTFMNITVIPYMKLICFIDNEMYFISNILAVTFRTLVPFVYIAVGNGILALTFLKSKKKFSHSNFNHTSRDNRVSRKENQFVYSIIAYNVLFIAFLLPLAFTYIAYEILKDIPGLQAQKNIATLTLVNNISVFLSSFNFTFAFPVNLKFNRVFRKEFVSIFKDFKSFVSVRLLGEKANERYSGSNLIHS